jgi:hypothetical protein
MPEESDGTARLTEQRLGELAGIQAPLRQSWANKGRLQRRGREGYEEVDAVELVALKALLDSLGSQDGPLAWTEVREEVRHRAREPNLAVVFDAQDKVAAVVTDIGAARSAAPYGHRVLFVDLAGPIGRVRLAYARATALH